MVNKVMKNRCQKIVKSTNFKVTSKLIIPANFVLKHKFLKIENEAFEKKLSQKIEVGDKLNLFR